MTAARAGRRRPLIRRFQAGRGAIIAAAAVALFGALLAAASPCLADEPPADPDLSNEGLRRAGPFWLGPTIRLKDLGYDNNVFYGDDDQRVGDYTATIAPGLRALLLAGHRGGFVFDQSLDYVAFQSFSQLNHWNSFTRGRGILLAGPSVLSLEDVYSSQEERPSSEIDTRVRFESNTLTGQARTRLTGRLTAVASAWHTRLRYVSGIGVERIAADLDRDERTVALAGELKLRPRTTALLEGAFQVTDFTNQEAYRDTTSVSLMPGVRVDDSSPLQAEIKAGIISLDAPDRDEVPDKTIGNRDYRGFIGSGALGVRLGARARSKVEAERALPFSILGDNLYAVLTGWSASFEQFFSRRMSGELRYARTRLEYPEPVLDADGLESERSDRFITYQLLLHYRLGDQLALTLSGQHEIRESTDETQDRDRNFIAFGSTLEL